MQCQNANLYAKMKKNIVYGTYHILFSNLDEYLDRKDRTAWYCNFCDFDRMREDLKRQIQVLTNIFSDCTATEKFILIDTISYELRH